MSLPEYGLNLKLDYAALGERVDAFLVTCLEDGHYVSRSISFHDHSDLSLGELAALVLERGTDKYDPHQKEVAQKAFSGYNHYFHIDLESGLYGGAGPELIGDARALPLPDGSVDTVFVVAALLDIDGWQMVMTEAGRVLRAGGRFLVFDYKGRVARRLGSPNPFTAARLLCGMKSAGLIGEHHLEFLPVHRIGPLRNRWVCRLVAPLIYLVSNWLIVSGSKPR